MGKKELLALIDGIRKTEAGGIIEARMGEFSAMRKKSSKEIFKELCFCILTANYSAEGGLKVQCEIGDGFIDLNEKRLAGALRKCGYRFPNVRAKYIVEAREHMDSIKEKVYSFKTERQAREWVVKNVKGLGLKEASHFLRNIGFRNLAIIDFHVVDLMVRECLTEKPKTLTEKKYLEIEKVLAMVAKEACLSLAELDLYLWYAETGKIIK